MSGEARCLEDDFVAALGDWAEALEAEDLEAEEQSALAKLQREAEKAPGREEIALEILRLGLALEVPDASREFKRWCARAERRGFSASRATLERARALENRGAGARVDQVRRVGADAPRVLALPPTWTRFFGRESEVGAIEGDLKGGARLVSLTGAGDAGKTRLALEVARRIGAGNAREFGLVA